MGNVKSFTYDYSPKTVKGASVRPKGSNSGTTRIRTQRLNAKPSIKTGIVNSNSNQGIKNTTNITKSEISLDY